MSTCPQCGADGAYVGLVKVECNNPECACYVAPPAPDPASVPNKYWGPMSWGKQVEREVTGLAGGLKVDDLKFFGVDPDGPCDCPLCTDARRAPTCDDVDAAVGKALAVPAWFRVGQRVRTPGGRKREIVGIGANGKASLSRSTGGASDYIWEAADLEPVDAPGTKCSRCGDTTACTARAQGGEPLCGSCEVPGPAPTPRRPLPPKQWWED